MELCLLNLGTPYTKILGRLYAQFDLIYYGVNSIIPYKLLYYSIHYLIYCLVFFSHLWSLKQRTEEDSSRVSQVYLQSQCRTDTNSCHERVHWLQVSLVVSLVVRKRQCKLQRASFVDWMPLLWHFCYLWLWLKKRTLYTEAS